MTSAHRPPSAIAVAAGLPGGNPLAAAIAAGETPSPDMVAAAGEPGTLSPAVGAFSFAGVLLGLIVLAPLMRDVNLIGLTKIKIGPQALTERAHTALRNLGFAEVPIAIDSSVPYASSSHLIVATVIALAAYGWHTALAGRPMLGAILLKDEPVRRA